LGPKILIGVHGNGLSTLLWMRPQLQSAVIEFFCPGGFARDYEWTASALGIGYYGVWDKQSVYLQHKNSALEAHTSPQRVFCS
jgi:hypothetical protein